MQHFIQKTLQLKDKNILIDIDHLDDTLYKGQKSLMFYGKLTYHIKICSHCQTSGNIVKNGTRYLRITLAPFSGLPAYLCLSKQRFLCRHCHKSFTAKTSLVQPHCFISNPVIRMVCDRATRTVSETDIAKDSFISIHSVRRIIDKMATKISIRPTHALPEHLSFDEFKSVRSVKAAMSFSCMDTLSHKLVDIVHDRKQSSLRDYFIRYDYQARQQVKTVTIDMYEPYIHLIHRCFPKAKIIIDPFHLVQALQRELNRLRVTVMNHYKNTDRPLYNKFKRYWKLLLKNDEDLSFYPYKPYPLFKWQTHEQAIVDYLLDKDHQLRETYTVVNRLKYAIKHRQWTMFETTLYQSNILNISAGLNRVVRSFKKYQTYIQHTFQYPDLTNGPIEGFHNKVKVLKRNAYGYRNYWHFRHRILLMSRLYEPSIHQKIVA